MRTYPFVQVDAFTTTPLTGNACAVVFDADSLSEAEMQAIAREQNLSETAFVWTSAIADVGARYFTASEEIPMAGHPTIATIHALVEAGRIPLTGAHTQITLELRVGPIPIDIYQDETSRRIVMSQKAPQFLHIYSADEVLPGFGLRAADALPNVPIQTVSTGTPQLMIAVRDHDALRRIQIDGPWLTQLRARGDYFSIHVFCPQGLSAEAAEPAETRTFARHFGLPPDMAEDPFTGSATGGMAAFLWHYGVLDSPSFIAEQGHWLGRPGQAQVEVVGPRDAIQTVKVGGPAVTVIRGELVLPASIMR